MVTKCSPLFTFTVAGEIEVIVPALALTAPKTRTNAARVLFTRPPREKQRGSFTSLKRGHCRGMPDNRCDADHALRRELPIVTAGVRLRCAADLATCPVPGHLPDWMGLLPPVFRGCAPP